MGHFGTKRKTLDKVAPGRFGGAVAIEAVHTVRDHELFKKKLRVEDIMAILDVTRTHAYKLCKDGKIPGAFRIGRTWRVHRDIFEAWLEETRRAK